MKVYVDQSIVSAGAGGWDDAVTAGKPFVFIEVEKRPYIVSEHGAPLQGYHYSSLVAREETFEAALIAAQNHVRRKQ